MKVKRYKDGRVEWRLKYDDYDEWLTMERLLKKCPNKNLTEKQLYDRLWRLDKNKKTDLNTVYLCATKPSGALTGRSGKQPTKSTGFVPFKEKIGVLGF